MPTILFDDMTLESFRNHRWHTVDGRHIPIGKLEDDHLINIIRHILISPKSWYEPYHDEMLSWLHKEAESRGLSIQDLEKANGVFTDPKDGKEKVFSFESLQYELK